jgi:hypothetical protein
MLTEQGGGVRSVNPEWEAANPPSIEAPGQITTPWEADVERRRAVVKMLPTSFRTYRLPTIGTGRAIRIVGSAPHPQRVLLEPFISVPSPPSVAPALFGVPIISASSGELNGPNRNVVGAGVPSGTVPIRSSTVFTLAPEQALWAAADTTIGPGILAVSVSQMIPVPTDPAMQEQLAQQSPNASFRNYRMPVFGLQEPIRIVPASNRPQRVILSKRFSDIQVVPPPAPERDIFLPVRVSSSASEFTIGRGPSTITDQANPSGAYFIQGGTRTLILAPDQPLYAILDRPVSPLIEPSRQFLSVSAYETNPLYPRGATGVPGPINRE